MGFKDFMKSATDGATDLVKKELEKKELERQQAQRMAGHTAAMIAIKTGSIGVYGPCTMRQRPEDGLVYFNSDEDNLYELIGYEWNGPSYIMASKSQTVDTGNSQTVKKGKSRKMAAGAIIGTLILPGVGTAVGAAIGAGGKGKSYTQSNANSTTEHITQRIEQPTTAILKFRKFGTGMIFPVTIECSTRIDTQIRCFQIKSPQSAVKMSKNTSDSLKGIKALKELLDMGAITQEEFELKKRQMLDL